MCLKNGFKKEAKHLSSFLKFIPTALNIAFILSPAMPFNLFRSKRCSCFRCPILGSIAALLFIRRHSLLGVFPLRVLSMRTFAFPL